MDPAAELNASLSMTWIESMTMAPVFAGSWQADSSQI
jgi:hypothetical protein